MIAQYIAFLRGINVGGHRKVPMAILKEELANIGFQKVSTILNSGNVIFESKVESIDVIERIISSHLEQYFDFSIPTIVRSAEKIEELIQKNPFKNIAVNKDIRLYISFLKEEQNTRLQFPCVNEDQSFQILQKEDKNILSVLDLSINGTPKGMEALEQYFGKGITTRNWNTIKRIEKKLKAKQ